MRREKPRVIRTVAYDLRRTKRITKLFVTRLSSTVSFALKVMLSIFLLVWSCAFSEAVSSSERFLIPLPEFLYKGHDQSGCTDASCQSKDTDTKVHQDFNAAQQIFYLSGMEQWLAQIPDNQIEMTKQTKQRDDYVMTPNVGAHKVHTKEVIWNDARQECIAEGAHLVVINSEEEESVINRMMLEWNLSTVWLGLHDLYQEGDWTTILDVPLAATGFARWTTLWPNEPDGGTIQNCVILMRDNGMGDIQCDTVQGFVCELPPV